MASYAENVSIWWRHHVFKWVKVTLLNKILQHISDKELLFERGVMKHMWNYEIFILYWDTTDSLHKKIRKLVPDNDYGFTTWLLPISHLYRIHLQYFTKKVPVFSRHWWCIWTPYTHLKHKSGYNINIKLYRYQLGYSGWDILSVIWDARWIIHGAISY